MYRQKDENKVKRMGEIYKTEKKLSDIPLYGNYVIIGITFVKMVVDVLN